MKAIEITKENREMLMNRYGSSDLEEFPIGYVLVAEFGDNGDPRLIGVLSNEMFIAEYTVGETLKNGFCSVTKK